MRIIRLTVCVVLGVLIVSSVSAKVEDATEKIYIEGAEKIILRGDLGVGEFRINPKDMEEAVIFDISYSTRHFDYSVDSKTRKSKCFIDFESECIKKNIHDYEDNDWDISLSTRYPISLEMDIGACEAEFDLSGLQISDISMDIGASSGSIDFSKENPIRMDEFNIDVGASTLDITNIGNANFNYFSFDGGAGSFDLDFRGNYKGESSIDIDIGVGSANIIMPKGVAIRVEADTDGWFSSVDILNRDLEEIDDGIFESDDFESSDNRIILTINVGMSSVEVRWK